MTEALPESFTVGPWRFARLSERSYFAEANDVRVWVERFGMLRWRTTATFRLTTLESATANTPERAVESFRERLVVLRRALEAVTA